MKKIGIFTFSWANNYGALLQNYALESWLEEHIANVNFETINFKCLKNMEQYDPKFKKPSVENIRQLVLYPVRLAHRIALSNIKARIAVRCDAFRKDEIHLSQDFVDKTELVEYLKSFDCVITGSDQVLNSNIVEEDWDVYSLQLFKNIPKIGYAVSAGNSKYIDKNIIAGGSLKEIAYLSVREAELKSFLEKRGMHVSIVADPVFLKTSDEWVDFIRGISIPLEKYILMYMPDAKAYAFAKRLAKKKHLKLYVVGFGLKATSLVGQIIDCGPKEFLYLIKNAEYIVTSSFHATAFSIIFQKNFYCSADVGQTGSRVLDLLKKINLTSVLIDSNTDIGVEVITDWDSVRRKIEEIRYYSQQWLRNAVYKSLEK